MGSPSAAKRAEWRKRYSDQVGRNIYAGKIVISLLDALEAAQVTEQRVERSPLPATRKSVTHKVVIESEQGLVTMFVTAGRYEDGRLGEVFVQVGKQGSSMWGMLDSWAIMISFALQYGIPLDLLVRRFEGTAFAPAGATSNPDIPMCSSVVDYVMRWLGGEFGDGEL